MGFRLLCGPAGRLDARMHGPAQGPPALVLAPHPRFGGTMGSRLVHDLAVGLGQAGWRAVRFDYRGVGRSEGTYGLGDGEAEDAAALWDALRGETGRSPAVVGHSFGGAVGVRLASLRPVARLVMVGTPPQVAQSRLRPLEDAPRVGARAHAIVGSHDGFVPVEDARALAAAFHPPATLTILEGAGHFLEPSHNARAVAAVLDALAPA